MQSAAKHGQDVTRPFTHQDKEIQRSSIIAHIAYIDIMQGKNKIIDKHHGTVRFIYTDRHTSEPIQNYRTTNTTKYIQKIWVFCHKSLWAF